MTKKAEEKSICNVCHKEIYSWQNTLEHHISYFPEIKIIIHDKCHMLHKIARKENPKLEKDYIKFYGKSFSLFCRRRPNWCKRNSCKNCNKKH